MPTALNITPLVIALSIMTKMVCRITWRKGEPLGLAIYPSRTFLDLPREVRDQIYYRALIASGPITVSSITIDCPRNTKYNTETKQKTISQKYTIDGKDPILDEITLGLLRCQSLVSSEAAAAFYQINTFHFDGNEVWSPLYTFLKDIGDSNWDLLRNVSIAIAEPYKRIYQDRYGARISRHNGLPLLDEVHSVHSSAYPLLPRPSSPMLRGIRGHPFARLIPRTEFVSRPLQYFDPAIQACFRLLGSSGSCLTLQLKLLAGIPGIDVKLGLSVPSIALPNFIEGLREEFAGSVAVLWNCVGRRNAVTRQAGSIQARGWDIIEAKDGIIHVDILEAPPLSILVTYLVLRRREADRMLPPFCESCRIRWPSNSL